MQGFRLIRTAKKSEKKRKKKRKWKKWKNAKIAKKKKAGKKSKKIFGLKRKIFAFFQILTGMRKKRKIFGKVKKKNAKKKTG